MLNLDWERESIITMLRICTSCNKQLSFPHWQWGRGQGSGYLTGLYIKSDFKTAGKLLRALLLIISERSPGFYPKGLDVLSALCNRNSKE